MNFSGLSPKWRIIVLSGAAVVAVGLLAVIGFFVLGRSSGGTAAPAPDEPPPPPLYVSPAGNDSNNGSVDQPFQTIQAALEVAKAGVTINLGPGVYREQPTTVNDGAPGRPITIKGPEQGTDKAGRYQAVVYGTERVFTVDNSYYTLDGFTIDGQEELADTPFPTDLFAMDSFKQSVQSRVADGRLIYIGSADYAQDLTGITINNMFISGAGGECVRLRNNAHGNAITNSVIQYCGMFGKGGNDDGERTEFHNGEGIYIGTSPKSDGQPNSENDESSNNIVTGNVIRTFGSECFNVKENAHDNVFENNVCSDNTESVKFEGSNVELRGHANVVRNNLIFDSAGYNLKIQSDEDEYDKGENVIENNRMWGSAAETMKIGTEVRQGDICGNVVDSPGMEDSEVELDVAAPCPNGGSAPPPP